VFLNDQSKYGMISKGNTGVLYISSSPFL